jgi:acetoin utilization deacetylase AcuC-like enzyme
MKVVYSELQKKHYPRQFLVNGVMQPNPEMPERCERLLTGALNVGCELETPSEYGLEDIKRVHTERYLKFLQHAWSRWSRIEGGAEAVTPNIHPLGLNCLYPKSVVAQAGFHMADLACPMTGESWDSICWSAWTAIHSATLINRGEQVAYALCRPPGHHAFSEVAGGFCFLNNSAIGAEVLQKKFPRIAILDVDLHHGNGTQGIFYQRDDVLTVSIHADPLRFYPFFWGAADETGSGPGSGYNQNFPLPRGSGDPAFLTALERAIEKVNAYKPDALVIALGLDAFEGDPFAGLAVTTAGYHQIAKSITDLIPLPTLIVQEGGYLCDELDENLGAFLSAFKTSKSTY